MGAKQQMNAGLSKDVVMKDLENNYRMIDKLKKENIDKVGSAELQELDYSRTRIKKERYRKNSMGTHTGGDFWVYKVKNINT